MHLKLLLLRHMNTLETSITLVFTHVVTKAKVYVMLISETIRERNRPIERMRDAVKKSELHPMEMRMGNSV